MCKNGHSGDNIGLLFCRPLMLLLHFDGMTVAECKPLQFQGFSFVVLIFFISIAHMSIFKGKICKCICQYTVTCCEYKNDGPGLLLEKKLLFFCLVQLYTHVLIVQVCWTVCYFAESRDFPVSL